MILLAGLNPVDHVVNHPFMGWVWSANVANLVLSGILTVLIGFWAAKKIGTGAETEGHDRYVTRNPLAHMLEVICVYLREETVRPLLGKRTDAFMPFLWTLFFFILINNMLGLIPLLDLMHLLNPAWKAAHVSPLGGTATQNLFVTGALALIAALVINGAGIKELGLKGYLGHLTGGAPPAIWPILIPVEFAGIFIKPVALAIRLFANMSAGHILMATLLMFITLSRSSGNWFVFVPVTALSMVGYFAIYFLEIFVGFLQAFVFMFLTTVFIAQLAHHDDHGHEHDHQPAGAH